MREIELSQNQVALVDDEDYDFLMQWKWHALKSNCKGRTVYYAVRSSRKSEGRPRGTIRMHHAIIGYPDSGHFVVW